MNNFKIGIKRSMMTGTRFEGEEYIVDLDRKFEGYQEGDLTCYCTPFAPSMPLRLEIAIRRNGSLSFRSWDFRGADNRYLHTSSSPSDFHPTPEQIDTVNGLFSGRIRFDGLEISVGKTVMDICPIDVRREEKLIGKKIYIC